jgi:hypothetical protein
MAAARSSNFALLFKFRALHVVGAAVATGALTVSPAARTITPKAANAHKLNDGRLISTPIDDTAGTGLFSILALL